MMLAWLSFPNFPVVAPHVVAAHVITMTTIELTTLAENDTQTKETPLTSSQIQDFIEKGYVLLSGVFSREASQRAKNRLWSRLADDGITKDPTTWVRRHGIAEEYSRDVAPWDEIVTPRLLGAIDQLCGVEKTKPFGCGWWVVTFPGVSDPPWEVDGRWHVDGAGYRHFTDSPNIGLLPIFLFNDIGPCDGGTVLCAGSHRQVISFSM
jgi:hypothetical protein